RLAAQGSPCCNTSRRPRARGRIRSLVFRSSTLCISSEKVVIISRAQLQHRREPVLHVVGLADFSALDGVNIRRHHPKPFSRMRNESAEQRTGRSATDLTAHDYMIVAGKSLLDLELHV